MSDEKIKVNAYSGYRGDENPRSFSLHDQEIEIIETLSMWIEEDTKNKARKRYFRVKGNDGYVYKIYYDENKKDWFLTTNPLYS
jgi:hypothetical protein